MHHPLCGAQSQAINSHQGEHAEDGRIRIGLRCPTFTGLLVIDPRFDGLIREPDGEAAAVDEGLVIVAPVTDAVSCEGSFLLWQRVKLLLLPD